MSFRDAIIQAGLNIQEDPFQDGRLHRFQVEGDSKKNCWYIYYPGPYSVGQFGCWKRSISQSWYEHPADKQNAAQRQKIFAAQKEAEKSYKEEQKKKQYQAKVTAMGLVKSGKKADKNHPYLIKKRIHHYGLKLTKDNSLVIPVFNIRQEIQGAQCISENGEKKFISGTQVKGNFHAIAGFLPNDPSLVYICEGFATGATLYSLIECVVIVAFSSGNLVPVAQNIRGIYPKARIIIAADNDQWTVPNVGIQKAQDAAKICMGEMIYPKFKIGGPDDRFTDFNDLVNSEGPKAALSSLKEYEKPQNSINLICLDEVKPQKIQWLWPGKLALGKICMIAGEPGLGKSQITADIAAIVSRGNIWPGSADASPQGKVIILSAEDDVQDTIKPRLMACDANHTNIFAIEGDVDLNQDIERLQMLVKFHSETKLIIIDPVTAYLGDIDSHKNSEVREIMRKLGVLASENNLCILIVTHLNKDSTKKAINRVMGSIGFIAAVRCAYGVIRDPDNEEQRLFLCIKNNIAIDNSGLSYKIHGIELENGISTSRIDWNNNTEKRDINQSMASVDEEDKNAITDAIEFLQHHLKDGPLKFSEIEDRSKKEKISITTLRRAKKIINIKITRKGFGRESYIIWGLSLFE